MNAQAVCHMCGCLFRFNKKDKNKRTWGNDMKTWVCYQCREYNTDKVIIDIDKEHIAKQICSVFRGLEPEIQAYIDKCPFDLPFGIEKMLEGLMGMEPVELHSIFVLIKTLLDLRGNPNVH